MKKYILILFTFLFLSIDVIASDVGDDTGDTGDFGNEVVKEVVLDALGNIVGYKYIIDGADVFYDFYDEQIDTLISASNRLLDAGKKLENYVVTIDDGLCSSPYYKDDGLNPSPYKYFLRVIYYTDESGFWPEPPGTIRRIRIAEITELTDLGDDKKPSFVATGNCYEWSMEGVWVERYVAHYTPFQTSTAQTLVWDTNYYDAFTPDGGGNISHYIGYGDPSKDIPPENDVSNPNGLVYNEDLANGVMNLNVRFKIDDTNIIKALEELNYEPSEWFDYLEKNTVFNDDDINSFNEFSQKAINLLGANEYDLVPVDDTNFSNVLDCALMSYSENDIVVDEDGNLFKKVPNESSVVVYPVRLLNNFFSSLSSVNPDEGGYNFPRIAFGDWVILEEQEFNFFDMIEDMGLSYLHSIYYLLTNVSMSFGLIYLALRKYNEWKEGRVA